MKAGQHVWLDLISRNGSRATPLAVVTGFDDDHPHAIIEAGHRSWADLIGTVISSSRTHHDTGDHLRESGLVGILVACLYWLFH